ncbi:hypothetical protein FGG08_000506 [Glutinoglossum americanum]|uniref:NAD-dependent epimerase/dehydratase domain-containing protein n=1 Tax=Glutinoglossum americanum TaxID=1670608 RepID=A0A9P8ICR5_9PEZI|nr:hypothetical protein FGG08_000506 [Glutinoglossum americanum]
MTGELVLVTGITGHVGFRTLVATLQAGYAVRGALRSEGKIDQIKNAPSIQPYLDRLEFVIVSDILKEGAFDKALEGVDYVLHIASPLPIQTTEYDRDIIQPAIKGTLGILASASKVPTVRRVVITSSAAIILPKEIDPTKLYSEADITPAPNGPFHSSWEAYSASKRLSYYATSDWYEATKPQFDIIRLMPSFVIGKNELITDKKNFITGSNALVSGVLFGDKATAPNVGVTVHLDDVAKAHVQALSPKIEGNQDFILSSDCPEGIVYDDAIEITKKSFPDAVASGLFPLGGTHPTAKIKMDVSKAEKAFGWTFQPYEEQVKNLVRHWIELNTVS